jgi:hypothetical protein
MSIIQIGYTGAASNCITLIFNVANDHAKLSDSTTFHKYFASIFNDKRTIIKNCLAHLPHWQKLSKDQSLTNRLRGFSVDGKSHR